MFDQLLLQQTRPLRLQLEEAKSTIDGLRASALRDNSSRLVAQMQAEHTSNVSMFEARLLSARDEHSNAVAFHSRQMDRCRTEHQADVDRLNSDLDATLLGVR